MRTAATVDLKGIAGIPAISNLNARFWKQLSAVIAPVSAKGVSEAFSN
jgi:hypothetical protein